MTNENQNNFLTRCDQINSKRRFSFAAFILVSSFLLASSWYGFRIRAGGDAWLTAEWLISYRGGFVRRGLIGELYFSLVPPGEKFLWILFLFQSFLYGFILWYFVRFLRQTASNWFSIALACNPASFIFVGLDFGGFARKESIGLSALVLLAIALDSQNSRRAILQIAGVTVFLIGLLSSEVNFAFGPLVFFLLTRNKPSQGKILLVRFLALFTSVSSLIILALLVGSRGSSLNAREICDQVVRHGLSGDLCSGSINSLMLNPKEVVGGLNFYFPDYRIYIPLTFLGLIPIMTSKWFAKYRVWTFLTLGATSPLFIVGYDWGRWVFMITTSLTIVIMSNRNLASPIVKWNPYIAIAFVLSWSVPHYGASSWPQGYLERLLRIGLTAVRTMLLQLD